MLTIQLDSRFADYASATQFAAKLIALNPATGTLIIYFDKSANCFRVEDWLTQAPLEWVKIDEVFNPDFEPFICLCTPGRESCRVCR